MRASKFLITGGKGTLGSRVVERLRDAGGNDLATGEGVDAIVDHAER